jgi:hypothetical protein
MTYPLAQKRYRRVKPISRFFLNNHFLPEYRRMDLPTCRQRVFLDEVAARLDLVAHQFGEDVSRRSP